MQIFEFHFNPKNKEDMIFDSFCYEPENVYEKRMGGLYMLGVLKNVLPHNVRFLDKLAKHIKEKYYKTVSITSEKSLKDTLKKSNEYLEKIAKTGDVSWLGNLSFSVITIKNFELNFTKTGDLKIYLIRKGQVMDTDQKLNLGDFEPYPLKVFGNIVSGKLAENDIILVLTKSMSDIFFQEKFLSDIARVSLSENIKEETKKIKEIFNTKKEKLTKSTGAALLIILSKEVMPKERETLIPKRSLKVFSIKESFAPILNKIKMPKIHLISIKKPNIQLPKLNIKNKKLKITIPKIKIPQISMPKIPKLELKVSKIKLHKKIILIPSLIVFLLLGYYIFQMQIEKKLENYQLILEEAKDNIEEAETYFILSDNTPGAKDKANDILMESLTQLSPVLKDISSLPTNLKEEIISVKKVISDYLYEMNKFTELPDPELFFEFNFNSYIPFKINILDNNLYFINPFAKNAFELNQNKEGKIVYVNNNIDFLSPSENSLLFLSKPNKLLMLENGEINEKQLLSDPYPNYNFDEFNTYRNNIYFLDKNKSRIVKYPFSNNAWNNPTLWLEESQTNKFKSMTIDGSIWLLTKDNQIKRYYGGKLQQTIILDIFPEVKDFSHIFTTPDLPYLYLIEPIQKRIIIINKSGEIIHQYQSQSFDNLLDIVTSENGRTIYLLSESKVYIINF
ncbi:MAG: hypothetical protein ABID67_02200 [Candidatus Nealsonbacteria bacterium]